MSSWRRWWHHWLAVYAQTPSPGTEEELSRKGKDTLSPGEAAALINQPASRHPANAGKLALAARRLQRQLGNHGVQLLAQRDGEPLSPNLRDKMSDELGHDLSDVRLHTGPEGASMARAARARAVTVGRDVAFEDGAYAPETPAGHRLLAHELAHTVQAGMGSGRDVAALEREARAGAHPTPGVAAPGQALREEPKSWGDRVREAQSATEATAKRAALVALVQEALAGYTLFIVPASASSGPVKPEHYQPAPAINFDFHLEDKEYWPGAGRKGKLGPRTGYYFSTDGKAYAIVGPMAIEASTPALTRMSADHELFHAAHHMGSDKTFNDREVEAWTDAFTHYFHEVYAAGQQWKPLIDYYEGATESAQQKALAALVAYYNKQPEEIQKAMLMWLKRRQGDMADKLLVKHLASQLTPPAPTQSAPAPAPPPPAP